MTIIKDYIDPTICPVCGAPNQEPYDYEVNSIEAQHSYCCSECDTDWVIVYELKPRYVSVNDNNKIFVRIYNAGSWRNG